MVQGLADRESVPFLEFDLAYLDARDLCHRRSLPEPFLQSIDRRGVAARQHFHVAVGQVDGVPRQSELLRLSPGAVTEPDTLDASADTETSCDGLTE